MELFQTNLCALFTESLLLLWPLFCLSRLTSLRDNKRAEKKSDLSCSSPMLRENHLVHTGRYLSLSRTPLLVLQDARSRRANETIPQTPIKNRARPCSTLHCPQPRQQPTQANSHYKERSRRFARRIHLILHDSFADPLITIDRSPRNIVVVAVAAAAVLQSSIFSWWMLRESERMEQDCA